MSRPLFEIAGEYRAMAAKLEAMDGMDEATLKDTLDGEAGDLEQKLIAYGMVIRNIEAEADAIKAVIEDCQARHKSRMGKAIRMRQVVLDTMLATNLPLVKSPSFDLKVKKNPASMVVTDEAKLRLFGNAKFFIMVPEVPEHEELDKAKLKAALAAGELVDGVELQSGHRIEIK